MANQRSQANIILASGFVYLFLLALCSGSVAAFAIHGNGGEIVSSRSSTSLHAVPTSTRTSRRNFLSAAVFATATASLGNAANAAVVSADVNTAMFQSDKTLGVDFAKERFIGAIADIDYLLDNYAEISQGGGDNVRRYLGTVGVTSRMYGMRKVLKELREEADDVIEFTETANDFEAYWNQAEGAAYQSLFAEHSSAKSTPESLLKLAKKDVQSMRKYMGDMADQLHLQ